MTIRIHGKDVPESLSEIVAPAHTALLVIDMQNDFCATAGSSNQAGGDMSMFPPVIERIARFAAAARQAAVPVIHTRMLSLPDGASDSVAWLRLKLRANRNYQAEDESAFDFTIAGTWGAEFINPLTPHSSDIVVDKYRSSALHNTPLDDILRSHAIQTVLVAGCTTEGCVESTVRDLSFHDYIPVLLLDCVASDHPDLHDASVMVMSAYRADTATADDVERCWQRQLSQPEQEKQAWTRAESV